MKGDQFLADVRNFAELENNEEAERAICATLETLRERLAGNEPSNLAAQLPPEIAPTLKETGAGNPSPWPTPSLCAQREGVGHDEAVRHARAEATVVQTAVTGGELDELRSQLGNAYEELFGQPGASA
jgi:uncharacterized protein (DUF2267 family)